MKVVIDPGHGGKDSGAVGITATGLEILEKNLNLTISILFRNSLIAAGLPANEILMTRNKDKTVELPERVRLTNKSVDKYGVFISIHCNSNTGSPGTGTEIFTTRGQTGADCVAMLISESLVSNGWGLGIRQDTSDGDADKEADFYVLKNTVCPAVLVECGFINNEADRIILRNEKHQANLALSLAQAAVFYLGVS